MDGELNVEAVGSSMLAVRGEIDMATAPQLAAALESWAATGQVVLDFADVSFMDSSGLKVLVAARHHSVSPLEVRIRNACPEIVRALQLCGLASTFLEDVPADG